MKKEDIKILVILNNTTHNYSFGATITEAKENLKKYTKEGFRFTSANHRIWIVGSKTIVTGIGNIVAKQGEMKPIDIT